MVLRGVGKGIKKGEERDILLVRFFILFMWIKYLYFKYWVEGRDG